jgi:hypothetical protein
LTFVWICSVEKLPKYNSVTVYWRAEKEFRTKHNKTNKKRKRKKEEKKKKEERRKEKEGRKKKRKRDTNRRFACCGGTH